MKLSNIYGLAAGLLASSLATGTWAATFPATDTAGADAVAVVDAGGGGDYLTLAAAAADFNAMAGGMARNWTIEIASDLTETANVGIANATNGFTLTIKPAASTTPLIDFTQLTDNAGPSGSLVIGSLLSGWTLSTMSGVVLDGSNNGTNSRDLTVRNASAAVPFPSPIHIVGATNTTVKNLVVVNRSTHTTNAGYGIRWTNRDNNFPNNGLTENNHITSTAGTQGQGIGYTTSGTPTFGQNTTGSVIRGNDVTARTRGIFLGRNGGTTTIEGNTVRVNQTTSGFLSSGLNHNSAGGATTFTTIVRNNEFLQLATANTSAGNFGIVGIFCEAAGASASYQVYNNVLTGFAATGTAGDYSVHGIRLLNANAAGNMLAEHNSIYMGSVNANGTTAGNLFGIGVRNNLTSGTVTIRNNIVLWEKTAGSAIFTNDTGGTFASVGNNIVSSGNVAVRGATTYANLGDWQGAGFDLTATGGQSVNPTTTSPGAWVSKTANLRFAGGAAVPMAPVASSTILTDIDGQVRPATDAWPGAFEQVGITVPVELDSFQID
ncbi:MAG: hypothetical protein KF858_02935 [Candidatus Sumerlaeia bacterium]|nr:hypothetical protein [Candidatus Sumerlaeia bacterium]